VVENTIERPAPHIAGTTRGAGDGLAPAPDGPRTENALPTVWFARREWARASLPKRKSRTWRITVPPFSWSKVGGLCGKAGGVSRWGENPRAARTEVQSPDIPPLHVSQGRG